MIPPPPLSPDRFSYDFGHPESFMLEVPANLWRGIEAVGGRLSVSTDRLIFQPHAFNIQSSPIQIPLALVREVRRGRSFRIIPNRMDVTLHSGERLCFVVGQPKRTIELVQRLAWERGRR